MLYPNNKRPHCAQIFLFLGKISNKKNESVLSLRSLFPVHEQGIFPAGETGDIQKTHF
jgi:hypothetical protein